MISLLIAFTSLGIIIWIFKTHSVKVSKKAWWSHVSSESTDAPESSLSAHQNPATLDYSEINRAYRIADMHFSRGDFEEAEKWFIRVLALHEYHPEALNRLGVIYIQGGNPRRAEILYRKLFSVTQKEPAYYANYGRCLYNQDRPSEAIEAYENAIKLDATRPTRFVSVGQIYYEQKDYQKALAYFVRALELDSQNIEYLSVVAEIAELIGDTDRMHKSLRKLLEIDPYNENAKKKMANF